MRAKDSGRLAEDYRAFLTYFRSVLASRFVTASTHRTCAVPNREERAAAGVQPNFATQTMAPPSVQAAIARSSPMVLAAATRASVVPTLFHSVVVSPQPTESAEAARAARLRATLGLTGGTT